MTAREAQQKLEAILQQLHLAQFGIDEILGAFEDEDDSIVLSGLPTWAVGLVVLLQDVDPQARDLADQMAKLEKFASEVADQQDRIDSLSG